MGIKRNALFLGALLALVAIVDWSIFGRGLPMLRHDWRFPADGAALGPMLATFFEGWMPSGMGESQPYPTFYYVGFILWPLHFILTPLLTVIFIVTAATLIIACSAHRIGIQRANSNAGVVLAVFAVLNPWVYTEFVAGHIVMVLAYGLLLAMVAEITRPQPRPWALLLLSAFLITQIEFWIVALVPFVAWCIHARRYLPVAIVCLSTLPIAAGIAASYHDLIGTSYNLEWQRAQSLAPDMAFALLGYPFRYAIAFEGWRWLIMAFALLGLTGIAAVWRKGSDRTVVAIGVICLILATGTRGPLAFVYGFVVAHVVESGVFRELFDLLAFVAIGYVVLAASAMRNRGVAAACAALAVLLLVPWAQKPAYLWFVPAGSLPAPTAPAGTSYRVAYLPAFQPLTYQGRGSGIDPDAFTRPGKMIPLNESIPAYPVDAALASAQLGDFRSLSALSVAQIISRPNYASDWRVLQYQLAFRRPLGKSRVSARGLRALPVAVLYAAAPQTVTVGGAPDENSVTSVMRSAQRFTPDRTTIDPNRAWIDARTAFIVRPSWGNPWGGVATSGHALLPLPSGSAAVFAQTTGRLANDRDENVATRNGSLHWFHLPAGSRALRCSGECIVVAALPYFPTGPEHAPAPPYTDVSLQVVTPWLATAELPPSNEATLRYNVRYDRYWTAYVDRTRLEHVALDGIVNGWIVRPSPATRHIVLIESLAAIQLLLEVLAAISVAGCLIFYAVRSASAPEPPRRRASDRFEGTQL